MHTKTRCCETLQKEVSLANEMTADHLQHQSPGIKHEHLGGGNDQNHQLQHHFQLQMPKFLTLYLQCSEGRLRRQLGQSKKVLPLDTYPVFDAHSGRSRFSWTN